MKECNWAVLASLFADDTVLLIDSERDFQSVVDEFYMVWVRRKLGVNTGKSKVMVIESKEVEMLNFSMPYRIDVPVAES